MGDIEKLSMLALRATELLSMAEKVKSLEEQVSQLQRRQHKALSSKEAAEYLGVTSATVVAWVNKGKIPAIMSRNGYRIPADKVFLMAERDAERRRARSAATLSV